MTEPSPLKTYQCHKRVKAAKIVASMLTVDSNVARNEKLGPVEKIATAIVFPLVGLAIGWVIHLFV